MFIVISETQPNPYLCDVLDTALDEVARQMNDGGMGSIWLVDTVNSLVHYYEQIEGPEYEKTQTKGVTCAELLDGFYS